MDRREKIANQIKQLTAEFLSKESNRTSLITVTHSDVSRDLKRGTIFVTIMPEDKEKSALDFLLRKRAELRTFFKKYMTSKTVPFIDIKLDKGEKNRQKIDQLLRESV